MSMLNCISWTVTIQIWGIDRISCHVSVFVHVSVYVFLYVSLSTRNWIIIDLTATALLSKPCTFNFAINKLINFIDGGKILLSKDLLNSEYKASAKMSELDFKTFVDI